MKNLPPKYKNSPTMAPKLKKNISFCLGPKFVHDLDFIMSQKLPIFPTVQGVRTNEICTVTDVNVSPCA